LNPLYFAETLLNSSMVAPAACRRAKPLCAHFRSVERRAPLGQPVGPNQSTTSDRVRMQKRISWRK
jgi:hypothetical protein